MTAPHKINDVVVVLPGIMGSTLARNGSLVWAPSGGAVLSAIATFGRSIQVLTLPAGIGDAHPGDGVEPVALMPDLHMIPGIWSANIGYGVLLDWLQARFDLLAPSADDPERIPNLIPAPYDWRLSNRYNARLLKGIVEPALERWRAQGGPCADARLIFVCHSMGGLVARRYIECEGGADLTRKLVTLGTPYRSALNALDQLVNGVRKGLGPFKLDLSRFARSLPSVHQLLPEYACIESPGGLLKTTETALPGLDTGMGTDAMRFHDELDAAAGARPAGTYDVHPIVGTWQRTSTTARLVGDQVEPSETIGEENEAGDGTVPRLAATPKALRPDSPGICWVPDQHGSLQSNRAVLDELEGILTAQPVIRRASAGVEIGVRTDPLVLAGEPLEVAAEVIGGERVALLATLTDERGRVVAKLPLRPAGVMQRASFGPQPPGAYRVAVGGVGTAVARVSPVACTLLVWNLETA